VRLPLLTIAAGITAGALLIGGCAATPEPHDAPASTESGAPSAEPEAEASFDPDAELGWGPTAGAWVAIAASNGGRSCCSISARVESSTGRVSWLSLVAAPWPGKCLTVETTPAASKPRTAAAVALAAMAGSSLAERVPIVGSAAPMVTSATGANTQVKPRSRSSSPVAYAAWRTISRPLGPSASIAAPAASNAGNSVAMPRRCDT
jgi:hypothetical protein